jgi:hypothetical protein
MKRNRFITFIIILVIALQGFKWFRQKEISFLVSIIRSEIIREYLFHGTPPIFSLGFSHPCFAIGPDDLGMIAANLLKILSSTISSDPATALKSIDKNQRFLSVIALSELELNSKIKTAAIPALHSALKDSDPEIRNLAIVALYQMNAITIPELRDGLSDPETRITAARAARMLGIKARPLAPELLKVALYQSYVCPYVTIKDVTEKIGIKPTQAVFIFRKGLQSSEYVVRTIAIKTLAEMGSVAMSAIPALEAVITNSDETDPYLHDSHLRNEAAYAIQCIKHRCPPRPGG